MAPVRHYKQYGLAFIVFGLLDGLYHFVHVLWRLSGHQQYNYRAIAHYPAVVSVSLLLAFMGFLLFKASSDRWRLVLFLLCTILSIFSLLLWNIIPVNTFYGVMLHGLLLLVLILLPPIYCFVKNRTVRDQARSSQTFGVEILCYVFIIILSIETAFRLVPIPNTYDMNPGVKFFWSDWVNHPLNAWGCRDRPFVVERSAKTFRILVVGDSFTEGAGLSRDETYCRVLENRLNLILEPLDRQAQVYNMGHCGLNTVEEVELVIDASRQLRPDMVIVAFFLNDAEQRQKTKSPSPKSAANTMKEFFLYQVGSYGYYFLLSLPTILNPKTTAEKNWTDSFTQQYSDTAPGWIEAKQSLKRLSLFAADNRIITLGIIFPFFHGQQYPAGLKDIHRIVSKTMNDSDIPALNLLPLFEQTGQPLEDFAFSRYDNHPNHQANKMVGVYLADHIAQAYVVPSAASNGTRARLTTGNQ